MNVLTRSPLASPATLQHAFHAAFPFPTAAGEVTRIAVRPARSALQQSHPSSPLASPGGLLHPEAHLNLNYHPNALPLQFNLSGIKRPNAPRLQSASNVLSLKPTLERRFSAFHGTNLAKQKPRRLSFADVPKFVAPEDALETQFSKLTTSSASGGVVQEKRRKPLKFRTPTPYPRQEGDSFFDLDSKAEKVPEDSC